MKRIVIIGAIVGMVFSCCGFIALFFGLSEMETTHDWNLLACVGYALMLPAVFLNYMKELTGFENAAAETVAMVVIQIAWYMVMAILIRIIAIRQKKCKQRLDIER